MSPIVPNLMASGAIVNLAALRPDQINFAEIASSLSKQARFNGRHRGPAISIGQHCVMGADALNREYGSIVLAGYFLLHDAHEHLLGDITRPAALLIAHAAEEALAARDRPFGEPRPVDGTASAAVREGIDRAKASLDAVILKAAGLPPIAEFPEYAALVAAMDERMCAAEVEALYGRTGPLPLIRTDLPPPKLTQALKPWAAIPTEMAFVNRLQRYCGIEVRPLC